MSQQVRESGLPVRCSMVSVVVLRGRGEDTRMLLARRSDAYLRGVWSYIAGHVETDESGEEAALRELREETGLVPSVLYTTGFCEQFYSAATAGVELVPAFVACVEDAAEVRLNEEHSACCWVSLDEAAERVPFGSQRDLLTHVQREFIERRPSGCLRIR